MLWRVEGDSYQSWVLPPPPFYRDSVVRIYYTWASQCTFRSSKLTLVSCLGLDNIVNVLYAVYNNEGQDARVYEKERACIFGACS